MIDLAEVSYTLFGIRLTNSQLAALAQYEQELLDWNARFNLTSIVNPDQVRLKHFLDSFSCMLALRGTPAKKVIDVGSGAGFPGLPMKIILPQMQLTLVESVGKKASFCQHIVNTLGLEGVSVIQERAEVVGQQPEHREQYDWAVARAVAILPVLMEFLLPLVRVGGAVLAMKGASAPAETQTGERAISVLGGHLKSLIPVALPAVAEERYLVVIEKIAATPSGYPRRVGVPAKKPL
jgi:16S rRNA (guanine527-N7)-methyltransferase